MTTAAPLILLSSMALHEPATVQAVTAPAHAPEWADWLAQIGFLPGEVVMLTARARPGGDPLVVRVGDSTFALRRAEAACVQVCAQGEVQRAPHAAAAGEGALR